VSRACERCGAALYGRRPDARFCSASCRRSAARERATFGVLKAAGSVEDAPVPASCRVHACEDRLGALERRLDELARDLNSADGRLMARAMRDALREDGQRG